MIPSSVRGEQNRSVTNMEEKGSPVQGELDLNEVKSLRGCNFPHNPRLVTTPPGSLRSPTSAPHSVAYGDISPRRGESSPCTGEALRRCILAADSLRMTCNGTPRFYRGGCFHCTVVFCRLPRRVRGFSSRYVTAMAAARASRKQQAVYCRCQTMPSLAWGRLSAA